MAQSLEQPRPSDRQDAASPRGPEKPPQEPAPAPGAEARAGGRTAALLFWGIVAFFVLEFVRPEALAQLRLQLLVVAAVPLGWALTSDRPWSRLFTAQTAFVLLCAQSIFTATNNFQAFLNTRAMFGNVAIAVGIAWTFSDRTRLRRGVWIWIAIMAYAAAHTVAYGMGPGGYVHDENEVALACLSALPFTLVGWAQLRGAGRWIAVGLSALFVGAIAASFSRGGFLGLVALVLFFVIASRHRVRNLIALGAGALLLVLLAPPSYLDEIRSIRDTESGTAMTRRYLWATATEMWKDNPVLGVGGGNFVWVASRYQPQRGEWPRRLLLRGMSGTAVHSSYFQLLAEQGTVGVLLVAYVIVFHFRTLGRLRRDVRARPRAPAALRRDAELYVPAAAGSMVAFLTAGAFLSTAYYPYLWYLSGLSVAMDRALRRELPPSASR